MKNVKKKVFASIVILAMVLMSLGVCSAFAADDATETVNIVADSGTGSVDVEIGTITTEEGDGLSVNVSDGQSATITTDAIDAADDGIDLDVWDAMSGADIQVNGDVDAGDVGIMMEADSGMANVTVDGGVYAGTDAVWMSGDEGGTTRLTINGDVEANEDAFYIRPYDGNAILQVTGDILAGDSGIDAYAETNGSILIFVTGDIYGDSPVALEAEDGSGITMVVEGDIVQAGSDDYRTAVRAEADGVESNVYFIVSGNVIAECYGVDLYAYDGGNVTAIIDGDIEGGDEGFYFANDEDGFIQALITGTIFGGEVPIATSSFSSHPEVVDICVWRVIPNEDDVLAAVEDYTGDYDDMVLVQNEDIEQALRYLIKLAQPEEGGFISVTDENGDDLANVYGFDVAYEGDKVLLKVELDEGYALKGAFNGEDGEAYELVQDEAGNYFIVVPRGGGVLLSVELEKAEEEEESVPAEDTPKQDGQSSVVTDTPAKVAAPLLSSAVPTGDSYTAYIFGGIAVLCLAGACTMFVIRRRNMK